uniref:Uncharacterized protein n=2 Tax=Ditylenchus dipsaci TaxID=166011 RepID=A0A915DVT1_9BILA
MAQPPAPGGALQGGVCSSSRDFLKPSLCCYTINLISSRFVPMVVVNDKSSQYEVDYGVFDTTESCDLHADYYMHPTLEIGYPSHNKPFNESTINELGGAEEEDQVVRGGDVNHMDGDGLTQDNRPLLIHFNTNTANSNNNNRGSAVSHQHHLHHHRAGSGFA